MSDLQWYRDMMKDFQRRDDNVDRVGATVSSDGTDASAGCKEMAVVPGGPGGPSRTWMAAMDEVLQTILPGNIQQPEHEDAQNIILENQEQPTASDAVRNPHAAVMPVDSSGHLDFDRLMQNLPPGLLGNLDSAKEAKFKVLYENFKARVPMLGSKADQFCRKCWHPGHESCDPVVCPVMRLNSYVHVQFAQPYRVGTGPTLNVADYFFSDLAQACIGYQWALKTIRGGDGQLFGVTIALVENLQNTLKRCFEIRDQGMVLPDPINELLSEEFKLTGIEAVEDEILPWVSVDTLVEPEEKMLADPSTKVASGAPKKPKRIAIKSEELCDLFNLAMIGDRSNAVCTKCMHRGHIGTSGKLCPVAIIEECLRKEENGRAWGHDLQKYDNSAAVLGKVITILELKEDDRYLDLKMLVEKFNDLKDRKSSPVLARTKRRLSVSEHTSPERKRLLGMSIPKSFTSPSLSISNCIKVPASELAAALDITPFKESFFVFLHGLSPSSPMIDYTMKRHFVLIVHTVGNREDTQCPNCHHFGHDQRAKACPFLDVKMRFENGALLQAKGIAKIKSLASVIKWFDGLPVVFEPFRKDCTAIKNLFSSIQRSFELAGTKCSFGSNLKMAAPAAQRPAGICVDISRMDGDLVAMLVPYFLDTEVPVGVQLDHTRVPPALFRKVLAFAV